MCVGLCGTVFVNALISNPQILGSDFANHADEQYCDVTVATRHFFLTCYTCSHPYFPNNWFANFFIFHKSCGILPSNLLC